MIMHLHEYDKVKIQLAHPQQQKYTVWIQLDCVIVSLHLFGNVAVKSVGQNLK